MGLSGEVVLAGPLVGYGYHNRPVESAAAFVPGLGFDRAYRTGDKGRIVWSDEGVPQLELQGRLSMEQVKLNARRVELGEIEATIIDQVPQVKEIATVVLDGSFLIAYVGLNKDTESNGTNESEYQQSVIAECRASAEKGLPAWMRPVEYVIMAAIPRITSGKTDRKTLQLDAKERFGSSDAAKAQAPADNRNGLMALDFGNVESVTANVKFALELVLGHDTLSDMSVSLQSIGVDSLRSMKFLQEARSLGIEHIGMDVVLASNTLKDLVQSVIDVHNRHADAAAESLAEDDDEVIMELEDEEQLLEFTFSQKLKHFSAFCRQQCVEKLGLPTEEIAQILPATALHTRGFALLTEAEALGINKPWTEHYLYAVPEHIDIGRLEQSIRTTLKKYDAFRSMFVEVEHPLAPFAICILSADSPAAVHSVVKMTVSEYSADPKSLWQQTIIMHSRRRKALSD